MEEVGIETEIIPTGRLILAGRGTRSCLPAGGIDPDRNVCGVHSKGTVNRTAYKNPEMDKLLDAGRATMDPAERLKIYRQVNNLLAKDLPYLQLTYFNNYSISGANVKGIVPVPDGLIRVRDVWKER
jgi:peptide/nickel transport system substrate-binding protein